MINAAEDKLLTCMKNQFFYPVTMRKNMEAAAYIARAGEYMAPRKNRQKMKNKEYGRGRR